MLRSANGILGHSLQGADGKLGRLHDVVFDDQTWTVRYIVVDTGGWLTGRQVLISPVAFGRPDWQRKQIPVSLTREQVENSPPISSDETVARKMEAALQEYYGWPAYWAYPPVGTGAYAPPPRHPGAAQGAARVFEVEKETHLRSVREIAGYSIEAEGGFIGHVEDFIIDDDAWAIRYIEVNTRTWLMGRKVLVAPTWIHKVSWLDRKVCVGLSKEAIRNAPAYDPSQPITREYEARLHAYYEKPVYW